jgi:hypothetical protein
MSEVAQLETPPLPAIVGARPLRKPEHERYARHRALTIDKVAAYRLAMREKRERQDIPEPDYATDRGNAAKLERKRAIVERIAYLTRQDEELLREKRARIEGFLWAAHETNYADYFQTAEEPIFEPEIGEDGKPTGKMVDSGKVRRYDRLRLFSELSPEQQRLIESLKWTEKGRPVLTVYTRSWANMELRKMLGIGPQPREPGDGEFSRLDDASLFAEIMREAKELGIDAEFTFKANGSMAP